MIEVRDDILRGVAGKTFTACIIADGDGIVAETAAAAKEAGALGLSLKRILDDGTEVRKGDEIARFTGSAKQILVAEEILLGLIAKPSGIATAAHAFVTKAGQRPRIVCGAWKKMPPAMKDAVRRAVVVGGAYYRICHEPFIYLDKNYVRILGGIRPSLEAVEHLKDRVKVVQLKGRTEDITLEALQAVTSGADILHVDSGRPDDVERISRELQPLGLRSRVKIAFGGNVRLEDVEALQALDIDILDVGREIVDAPLLDLRLEAADLCSSPCGGM